MKEFLHVPIFLSTGSFFENKILKELFKEKNYILNFFKIDYAMCEKARILIKFGANLGSGSNYLDPQHLLKTTLANQTWP